jgi:hypothetical protein
MWHMFRRSHSLKSCVQVQGPLITAFANPWSKAWNDSTIRMAPPPAPPPAADRCRWRRLLPLLLPLLLVLATGQASAAEVPGGQSSLTPGQTLEQVGTVAAGQGEIYPDIAPPAGTNPALVITLTPLVRCRPCHSTAHALPQHSTAQHSTAQHSTAQHMLSLSLPPPKLLMLLPPCCATAGRRQRRRGSVLLSRQRSAAGARLCRLQIR